MADTEDRAFDIREARRIWAEKEGEPPRGRKAQARKKKHQQIAGVVDKRSLRATGRTEQFNFRCIEGLKAKAQEAASAAGVPLAAWMEEAVAEKLEKLAKPDGGDNA